MRPAGRRGRLPARDAGGRGAPLRAVVPGALLAAVLAASCFSERSDPTSPVPAECRELADQQGVDSDDVLVGIRDFAFQPAEVRIEPGTTVTWINCEPAGSVPEGHTSTADDGLWNSGLPTMKRGDTFSFTYAEAGSFPYHCIPHPFMEGEVVVE